MKNNALKKYRDPFYSLFDGWDEVFEDWGKGLDKFVNTLPDPFDYPYYRTVKSVGRVNLASEDDHYKVELTAPGFTKEEMTIEMKDNVLTISGEHKADKTDEGKNYTRREFAKSSFTRSFKVPTNVTGDVDAKFENGILTLSLKKKELPPKEEIKKIEIK